MLKFFLKKLLLCHQTNQFQLKIKAELTADAFLHCSRCCLLDSKSTYFFLMIIISNFKLFCINGLFIDKLIYLEKIIYF